MPGQFPAGPKDQATVQSRPDMFVFSTPVLTEDLEITCKVAPELFAATDEPTTDWVVTLCDVDENGVSANIVDGITRGTTEADRANKADISLWSTSIVVKPAIVFKCK